MWNAAENVCIQKCIKYRIMKSLQHPLWNMWDTNVLGLSRLIVELSTNWIRIFGFTSKNWNFKENIQLFDCVCQISGSIECNSRNLVYCLTAAFILFLTREMNTLHSQVLSHCKYLYLFECFCGCDQWNRFPLICVKEMYVHITLKQISVQSQ